MIALFEEERSVLCWENTRRFSLYDSIRHGDKLSLETTVASNSAAERYGSIYLVILQKRRSSRTIGFINELNLVYFDFLVR